MKPNFVGIGAQKCASSWIYGILSDHPDVVVSRKKELDFFSYWYEHGFQWYERKFPEALSSKIVGEVSPSYFHDPRVPQRIRDYNENMKLILTLRDPVERAYSQHKHEIRIGTYLGPDFSFEAGLRQNPGYIEQGLYATHLKQWLRYFNRERLEIVSFEEVKSMPLQVSERVYRFLGVNDSHKSKWLQRVANPSFAIRSHFMEEVKDRVLGSMTSIGARGLWNALANSPVGSAYRLANRMPSEAIVPPMLRETREALTERFAGELQQLKQEFGVDLGQ